MRIFWRRITSTDGKLTDSSGFSEKSQSGTPILSEKFRLSISKSALQFPHPPTANSAPFSSSKSAPK